MMIANPALAMAQGAQYAQTLEQAKNQNALSNLYQQQGPQILAGDQNALGQVAQLDPAAAMQFQGNVLDQQSAKQSMAFDAEKMQMIRDDAKTKAMDHAAAMTAEQRKAEADKTATILSGAAAMYSKGDQAGYNAFLQQQGVDPAKYPFQQFPAYAAMAGGALDALATFDKMNAPAVPLSPEGKFAADKKAGLVPADAQPSAGADGGDMSLTPQYITDAAGNLQMVQISKHGGPAQIVPLPDGAALQKGVEKLDLGTSFQWYNTVTGQAIGQPIPKDITGQKSAEALGTSQGDALAAYKSLDAKMPGLEKVVSDLNALADKATYTLPGQALDIGMKFVGMSPRDAAIARADYIAKVDNQVLPLLRDTFGAAFTEKEGNTLRATLGDPDKSPAEKKVVLQAFIDQKKRDLEALAKQSGSTATIPVAQSPGQSQVLHFDAQGNLIK